MKTLQAKEGYVFIKKDKSEVYGNLIYTPDNFDETLLTQVKEDQAKVIRKAIEDKHRSDYDLAVQTISFTSVYIYSASTYTRGCIFTLAYNTAYNTDQKTFMVFGLLYLPKLGTYTSANELKLMN